MIDPKKEVRAVLPMWGAIVASDVALFGLAFLIKPSSRPPLPATPVTFAALALVAAVAAVVSVVLPARKARSMLAVARLSYRSAPPGAPAEDRVIDRAEESLPVLRNVFARALSTGWGLALAVVLVGDFLRSMGLAPLAAAPFFAVSLALLFWHFPSPKRFVTTVEQGAGARLSTGD